jgi:hypothetical protein
MQVGFGGKAQQKLIQGLIVWIHGWLSGPSMATPRTWSSKKTAAPVKERPGGWFGGRLLVADQGDFDRGIGVAWRDQAVHGEDAIDIDVHTHAVSVGRHL